MLREEERRIATRMLDNKHSPKRIAEALLVDRNETLSAEEYTEALSRITRDIEVMDICNYDHSPIRF